MHQKIFLSLFLLTSSLLASDFELYYVNADVLKVRTGPSSSYEHSYSMYNKQKARVYKVKDGWAKVSRTRSQWAYAKFLTKISVEKDSKKATPKKATTQKKKITPQKVAPKKAVPKTIATQQKKTTPKKTVTTAKKSSKKPKIDSRLLKYIKKSDNYEQYSKVFLEVSQKLISNKVCKVSDFRKTNGWMKLYEDEMYFAYCGGFKKKDKIYINLVTNELIGDMKRYK